MKQMVFIMGTAENETKAVELLVLKQKENVFETGTKEVISKILDLRNIKPVEGGAYIPFQYVYERVSFDGYPVKCQFLSKDCVKAQYPWFF